MNIIDFVCILRGTGQYFKGYRSHSVISKLRKYVSFTNEQIRELADIGVNNSQVYQILVDEDLSSFYEKLLENNKETIEDDIYSKIMTQIHQEEINNGESVEEIPF